MKKILAFLLLFSILLASCSNLFPVGLAQSNDSSVKKWDSENILTTYRNGEPIESIVYSAPQVIWDGTQYVEYIFDQVSRDEFRIQCPRVALHIKSSDVRIYNANMTKEVASKTVWEVWKSDKDKMKEVGVKSQTFSYEMFNESVRIIQSQVMNDGSILNITYDFDNFGKYSISFSAAANATYKLLWHVEIPKSSVHKTEKKDAVAFYNSTEFLLFLGWEDAKEYFNDKIIEPLGSGEKVNVVFANREFYAGEVLFFDPIFYSEASLDGFIDRYGVSYPPSTLFAYTSSTELFVGQDYAYDVPLETWFYHQYRGYLSFDTSSIPDDTTITAATLYAKTTGTDNTATDFYVNVYGGSQPIYGSSLDTGDWGSGTSYQSQWWTGNWQPNTWVSFGIATGQVNKVGRTQFELKSSREGTTPTGQEFCRLYTANSDYDPYLSVSYTTPKYYLQMQNVHGKGTTTPSSPGTYEYNSGTQVTLSASTTETGWSFNYWIIDGTKYTENPKTITMNQDHTVKAYFKYTPTSTMKQNAANYLISHYNSTVGLLWESEETGDHWLLDPNAEGGGYPEYEGYLFFTNTYWVYSDNLFAMYAMEPYNLSMSSQLKVSYAKYETIYGRSYVFEVLFGEDIPDVIASAYNVLAKKGSENDYFIMLRQHVKPATFDISEFADMCIFKALDSLWQGSDTQAREWFYEAYNHWDGKGIADSVFVIEGSYVNYKLALVCYAYKLIPGLTDVDYYGMLAQLWKAQRADNGGIRTRTDVNGNPYGSANVEATALNLLIEYDSLISELKNYPYSTKSKFREVKNAIMDARDYLDFLAKNITVGADAYTIFSEYPALPLSIYVHERDSWRLVGWWESEPGEWLYGFDYRKNHTISGVVAKPLYNFNVKITVHYGNGTDSGEHVYLGGKCRTDFADIRFTNSSGIGEFPYNISSKVNGDYAVFKVCVDYIPSSPNSTVIYIYCGKPDSITTSVSLANYPGTSPSTVGTTTSTESTLRPPQRKSFYAIAKGRTWVFYFSGTYFGWRSRPNGGTWSGFTPITGASGNAYCTSLHFDGTYIHLAMAHTWAEGGTLTYYRGIPNADGTITWGNLRTVDNDPNTIITPTVTVDSNGYPWIVAAGYFTNGYRIYVYKATATDGSTWSSRTDLNGANGYIMPVILPKTNGQMYCLYALLASPYTLYGKNYDGSSWGSVETLENMGVNPYSFSAVSEGDTIHVAYRTSGYIKYNKRNSSWGTAQTVWTMPSGYSSYGTAPVLSQDIESGVLVCFWDTPNCKYVYYKKCIAGTWDTNPTTWIDESSTYFAYLGAFTCFYNSYGNCIGLVYITGSYSPYNIRFASLGKDTFVPQPNHGSWGQQEFYDDTIQSPACLVRSIYSLDTVEQLVYSFETDGEWGYSYKEPVITVTIYHNESAMFFEVNPAELDSGRTVDIYLRNHELFSDVTKNSGILTAWFNGSSYYNDCISHRYTVRHGVQMGYVDALTRQLTDRASRCKNMLDDYEFTFDKYLPMYFYGREWGDLFMYDFQNYRDVVVYDQLPKGTDYYPYWSKVGIWLWAYIQLTKIDPLERALQAVHVLNRYGNPDIPYDFGFGITITPRQTARWIESNYWNGYGIAKPLVDKTYAIGVRTASFLVLETLLGYVHGDATSKAYADKTARYLIRTQWAESGWGYLDFGGKVCRPLHGGGFMVAYKYLPSNVAYAFGVPSAGGLSDIVEGLGMPLEYDGLVPTNEEAAFAVSRALEVYLQYAFASQGQHDITADKYVLQGYMFKNTDSSNIKYMNVTLRSGTYTFRVTAKNWGDEYNRTVRLYVDGSLVEEWTALYSADFDQSADIAIASIGIHKIGLVIITSDYKTPDNYWVADLSVIKK